jgi:hypothetical protein
MKPATATPKAAIATPSIPADILLATDKLSFRILAQQKDFTPADVNALMNDPSATPRNGEFVWLDANSVACPEAIRNGRGAMLAFNKPPKVMLADGSWSITAAFPDKDLNGHTNLTMKFDKQGAKVIGTLTGENIGQLLAMIIDDRIVFAPKIESSISETATISGDFTDDDVMKMLRALLPKKLIQIESRVFTAPAGTSDPVSVFIHDTLAIRSVESGRPLTKQVTLSNEQGKKLLSWISSAQTIKLVAAPSVSVPNGENAEVGITSKDPNNPGALPGSMKLSMLPYLLKGNRIWMNFAIEAATPTGAGAAANAISIDSVLVTRLGENILIPLQPNNYFLLKASIAEPAKPKPSR